MLVRAAVRIVALSAIVAGVTRVMPGVDVDGSGGLLWLALLFSTLNLVLAPALRLMMLPVARVSLALLLFLSNAALLAITAAMGGELAFDGSLALLLSAATLAAFSWLTEMALPIFPRRCRYAASSLVE